MNKWCQLIQLMHSTAIPLGIAILQASVLFSSFPALSQNSLSSQQKLDLEEQLQIPLNNGIEGEPRNEADLLLRLGGQAQRSGNLEKAIAYWVQARDLYQQIGDFEGLGLTYDYLGLTYANLGRYPEAEEALRRRLGVARYIKDFGGQIFGLNNLGTLLLQAGNIEAASVSFTEALDIARTVKNREGEGLSLNNLGLVAAMEGNYFQAIKHYESALVLRRRLGDSLAEANTQNNLADVYFALKQYRDAGIEYGVAFQLAKDSRDIPNQFRALRGMVQSYGVTGPESLAFKYLDRYFTLAQEQKNQREELISLRLYAQLYKGKGDLANARIFYERAIALANSLGDSGEEAFLRNDLAQILFVR